VPVPEGLDPQLAAAVMLQGMTAHYLVNSTYPVQPGDCVLVHAAAGGVGQLLVQLAAARGARVIGTVSTEAKAEKARAAGADVVIRYGESADAHALADEIRGANGGNGVSVAYDGVGQATFEASLAALAPRGMAVLFGGASGQVPPFDLQRLNQLGGLFVTRPSLVHYTATREELLWRGLDVLGAVADGGLRVEIGGRYPLDKAAQAYDDLENRRTTGKLLLVR
jgi:NADPH2:quinone reductase